MADGSPTSANAFPPVPPPGANPVVLDPDSGSPRGRAHNFLLHALVAHDAHELSEAISMAKVVGIEGDGLEAAERLLESLGGGDAETTGERQSKAVTKLQGVLGSSDASEIQAAIEEAVEAGVDDKRLIADAERALQEIRSVRFLGLDAVVKALEVCVEGAQRNPAQTCPPETLKTLQQKIEELRKISGSQDEDFAQMAGRLVAFEKYRTSAFLEMQDKVRQRVVTMDRIRASQPAALENNEALDSPKSGAGSSGQSPTKRPSGGQSSGQAGRKTSGSRAEGGPFAKRSSGPKTTPKRAPNQPKVAANQPRP